MNPSKWLARDPLFGLPQCVYCGGVADTSDHTPPRSLLPRELPKDVQVMTVPACQRCNGGYSTEETLTAAVVATVSFGEYDRRATREGGWLDSAKKKDISLARFLDERLGADGIFKVDERVIQCLSRVLTKTAVGLIFFEFGLIVPKENICLVGLEHAKNILPDAFVEQFRRSDNAWAEVTPSGRELERQVMALAGLRPPHTSPWKTYIAGFFEYKLIRRSNQTLLCAMLLHDSVTALFESPWPSQAGPRRRGKPSHMRGKPTNRR